MSARDPRVRQGVALAAVALVVACLWLIGVPAVGAGAAYLSPAVFVFLVLWLGRYPGESVISRFVHRLRRRHAGAARAQTRQVVSHMPRGGGLLAAALAGRAPPSRTHLVRGRVARPFWALRTHAAALRPSTAAAHLT